MPTHGGPMSKTNTDIHQERQARGQRRLSVWITAEQEAQLKESAEAAGLSVSEAVRLALEAAGLVEAT